MLLCAFLLCCELGIIFDSVIHPHPARSAVYRACWFILWNNSKIDTIFLCVKAWSKALTSCPYPWSQDVVFPLTFIPSGSEDGFCFVCLFVSRHDGRWFCYFYSCLFVCLFLSLCLCIPQLALASHLYLTQAVPLHFQVPPRTLSILTMTSLYGLISSHPPFAHLLKFPRAFMSYSSHLKLLKSFFKSCYFLLLFNQVQCSTCTYYSASATSI